MVQQIIFDAAAGGESKRRVDENGYLRIDGCPITSPGVFDYARSEAQLEGDPNELVKVSRPAETVTSQAFLDSCQNIPLIDDHTYLEGLTVDGADEPDGVDPSKKGVCGILTNVRWDEATGWVIGDIVVYSRAMIRQIMAGKKTELSLGFTCVFTPVDGEAHAAIQTDMAGNHLARVDRARVAGARILDSAFPNPSNEDESMAVKAKKAKALDGAAVEKLREILLPALQQFLSEAAPAEGEGEVPPAEGEAPPAEGEVPPGEGEGEGEAPPAEVKDDEDGGITALLQQLLAALAPPAEGGDEAEGEEAEAGDEAEGEEAEGKEKPMGDEEATAKPGVTMDSMFKAVAERDKLYARVSKVTGAFDHAAMSTASVAAYGVKKLGVKCKAGDAAVALSAYLDGVEAQASKNVKTTTAKVGDAASSTELDAYLSGK